VSNQVAGIFEPNGKSGGFVRDPAQNYRVRPTDPRVPEGLCRELGLRGGELLAGVVKAPSKGGRGRAPELQSVTGINDVSVDDYIERTPFEDLVVIDPDDGVRFETEGGPSTMRVVDLMTPIGLGQRGLIVAPPRTGKTVLLQHLAAGMSTNYPDVYVMVLLIDERPEEVTHMRKNVNGEVVASSNDNDIASHVRIARLMIEKAKRMVETGRNVFILLDSLTRLGRAFNAAIRGSGRIMSGGLDIRALNEPKSIFGAARNIEGGGSLTIMASALIETGSRMDDVIFNEFKGTGNMEIVLTRELANLRIFPAIDLEPSGTRKEELLLTPEALEVSYIIRRNLAGRGARRSMETLLDLLARYPNNSALVSGVKAHGLR
jgi:transcription termination factor Rho